MRKLRIGKKSIIALACTVALAVSGFGAYQVHASKLIDTEKDIYIKAEVEQDSQFYPHYQGEVTIKLYKIADVKNNGEIGEIADGFKNSGVDLSFLEGDKATVESIKANIADKAYGVVNEVNPSATITIDRAAGATSGSAQVERGLYLYVPQSAKNARYEYDFTYYVIMAPSSNYISGVDATNEWLTNAAGDYESAFKLKPVETQREGSIKINKTLDTFNTSLGTASFIFEVEAVLDEQVVFSNVYSIDFDSYGTNSITIDGIPATAVVSVKEVYSGAAYQVVEGKSDTVEGITIVADETQQASFENTYDDRVNVGGASTVNTFKFEKTENGGSYIYVTNLPEAIPQ